MADLGTQPDESLTDWDRHLITRRTMALLEGWGLGAREIIEILALPNSVKVRQVTRFRDQEPFPMDGVSVQRRLTYLMRIENALNTYFPKSPEMRTLWIRRGNRKFGRRAPLALMLEEGEQGLATVLAHLDCTFAWDQTGSKSEYHLRREAGAD